MRLIATSRAVDGTPLGRDILVGRADGAPLLRAGVPLTARYRRLLMASGISAIYVDDNVSAGIAVDTPLDDETRVFATQAVANMQQVAVKALDRGGQIPNTAVVDTAIDALADVVARILAQIEQCGGVALALNDLSTADGYTFQHSLDVAALGLIVGRHHMRTRGWVDYRGELRFDQIESRLTTLGIGLLLHDIGKLAVPLTVLNKPGKLNSEEWKLMTAHPRAGLDMLAGDRWDPLVKSIVLRHHERWDGSGYPDHKVGQQIHEMARIAAVADVYDAITSVRPYAQAEPAHVGVAAILAGHGTLYDPAVVESFAEVVAPFPAGSPVTLSDGRQGIVVRVPEQDLNRPLVRIIDGDQVVKEIDLLDHPELQIQDWICLQQRVAELAA